MRPRNSLRKSSFRRLGVCEQLEDRAMLSAHGFGFGPTLQQFGASSGNRRSPKSHRMRFNQRSRT